MDYVRWSAVAPAKAWGLYPHKGVIAAGALADIVLVDLARTGGCSRAGCRASARSRPGTAARCRACRCTRWCAGAS
jgi:dihydroorotase-like cyclic amidohydrolase